MNLDQVLIALRTFTPTELETVRQTVDKQLGYWLIPSESFAAVAEIMREVR